MKPEDEREWERTRKGEGKCYEGERKNITAKTRKYCQFQREEASGGSERSWGQNVFG